MSDFTLIRSFECGCGRTHTTSVENVIIRKGAVDASLKFHLSQVTDEFFIEE